MKYIRTEDGIYQFENNENICKKDNELFEIQRFFQPVDHINYKLLGKIKAEADTIEELCDEYVLPKFRDVFAIDTFSKQICVNHIKCGNGDVFGAIWTSKGLIYVAKMNDEGVLELI